MSWFIYFQNSDVVLPSERHDQGAARRGRNDDGRRHPKPAQEVPGRRQPAQVRPLRPAEIRFRESAQHRHADLQLDAEHPGPRQDEETQ